MEHYMGNLFDKLTPKWSYISLILIVVIVQANVGHLRGFIYSPLWATRIFIWHQIGVITFDAK